MPSTIPMQSAREIEALQRALDLDVIALDLTRWQAHLSALQDWIQRAHCDGTDETRMLLLEVEIEDHLFELRRVRSVLMEGGI